MTYIDAHNLPEAKNALKPTLVFSGKKVGANSKIDLVKVKEKAKAYGCTVNDYLGAILSTTLHEYYTKYQEVARQKFEVPSEINLAAVYSNRQPEQNVKDLKLRNELVTISIRYPIQRAFKDALPAVQNRLKEVFTSYLPMGNVILFALINLFPFTYARGKIDSSTRKLTICYSNLNATRISPVFDGKKHLGQFYYGGAVGMLAAGLTVVTMGDYSSISFCGDKAIVSHPQELVDMFVRHIDHDLAK